MNPAAPDTDDLRDGPTALILGTLHGQAEAIEMLREPGWSVHSCGLSVEGPGVDAADQFHLVDIVDADAVEHLARTIGANVVYSVGSDIAMPTVATVSERLGLPQFHDSQVTAVLHEKARLREFLAANEISPVAFRVLRTVDDLDGFDVFPAIVKPSDSQGQRGITIIDDVVVARDAFTAAVQHSPTRTAVIEEFLEGDEISVHVFVVDGEVRWSLPSDRFVWDGPAVGIPSGHRLPAMFLRRADRPAVDQLIGDVVSALGVRTGPLYFQLKLTPSEPRIVEIAPRLDGCHLWRLIELHTGFNIMGRCFDLLAGRPWEDVNDSPDEPVDELWFMLANPAQPVDRSEHPAPDDGTVLFEEFQVDDGVIPRAINPAVARIGYRVVRR